MKHYLLLLGFALLSVGTASASIGHSTAAPHLSYTIQNDSIYIPTAFSPNEDGRNDRFEIFFKPGTNAQIKSYHIFNRWGSMLFESENFSTPAADNAWWDGYFRGEKVRPGLYVYKIEVEYANRSLIYTGEISVVD
jgi:gliding motility-associated-like protein